MYTCVAQRQEWGRVARLLLLACAALTPAALFAESHNGVEVKPFGTLETDAKFSVRYLLDENDRVTQGQETGFEDRSTWEQELELASKNYVYHPGFLNMEFAGGPVLVQQRFDSNPGSFRENDTLLNFLARFNFLELKSYPFSLYYRRSHPSITTSLSGRFLTRNNEYGFNGRVTGLVPATQLSVDASHRDANGSGFGMIVDEDVDRGVFRWETSYRESDRISVEYDHLTQDSRSGSTGLPIQESTIEQKLTNVKARNAFGSRKQFELDQLLSLLEQDTMSSNPSALDNLNYTMSARWQMSEASRSAFGYRYFESDRVDANSNTHDLNATFLHAISESTRYDVFADHEMTSQTGFDRVRSGFGGNLNHNRQTGFGSVSVNLFARMERNDQDATSDTVRVVDEPVTLVGTTPVDLANEFVVGSSIVVTNQAGTQEFIEDVDYRVIVVGSITSIQRLIGGNIFDGQTVLVDYEFLTSGTAKYDTVGTGVSAAINFLRYANAQVRYQLSDSRLLEGQLTTPVNDFDLFEVSLGADFPIGHSLTIGGELRHLDRNETIAPFVRDSVSINASSRVNGSLRLYGSASLVQVDQKESIEDVDQVNYRLGITGRAFGRLQLTYEAAYLEDTGGSLFREQLQHRLNLQGRYRKLLYVVRAQYSEVTQGVTQRNDTQVTAEVTRVF